MRAVTVTEFGGPEVLKVADVPDPEPGSGQVRIRVLGAAVNPVDASMRAGRIPDLVFPFVPGWDVAGVIEQVGSDVERFELGQPVVGVSVWFVTRQGTQAELVVLEEAACAYAPAGIAPEAAASLPLNGLTAWSALITAKVERGDRLLVTGAAGAVGGYLVQLASARGIEVIGLGRPGDRDSVLTFGASEFVEDVTSLTEVPVAIDTAGVADAVLAVMSENGRLVTLSGQPATERAGVTVKPARVRQDADALTELCRLASAGDLVLRLAETASFDQAPEAYAKIEAGGLRGAVVLVP